MSAVLSPAEFATTAAHHSTSTTRQAPPPTAPIAAAPSAHPINDYLNKDRDNLDGLRTALSLSAASFPKSEKDITTCQKALLAVKVVVDAASWNAPDAIVAKFRKFLNLAINGKHASLASEIQRHDRGNHKHVLLVGTKLTLEAWCNDQIHG